MAIADQVKKLERDALIEIARSEAVERERHAAAEHGDTERRAADILERNREHRAPPTDIGLVALMRALVGRWSFFA